MFKETPIVLGFKHLISLFLHFLYFPDSQQIIFFHPTNIQAGIIPVRSRLLNAAFHHEGLQYVIPHNAFCGPFAIFSIFMVSSPFSYFMSIREAVPFSFRAIAALPRLVFSV